MVGFDGSEIDDVREDQPALTHEDQIAAYKELLRPLGADRNALAIISLALHEYVRFCDRNQHVISGSGERDANRLHFAAADLCNELAREDWKNR